MISCVPARAIVLVGPVVAACSSHVDVGFTNEGGAQAASYNDAGRDAGHVATAMDGDSGASCVIITSCENGMTIQTISFAADWCVDACHQSSPDCDAEGIDLSRDPNNCGRCGRVCLPGERCVMSDCR
jgi:hypothetical protein